MCDIIEVLTNPNGFSGHCSNDGTPLTNAEYYRILHSHENNYH